MLTFVIYGLAFIIALALLNAAFRELGHGIRGFGIVTRGIMEAFGVRPEAAQTRRERIGMVVMAVLIAAGVASGVILLVRWAFT